MKAKFSAGKLAPILKDLERGNSILICTPRLERDTEIAQPWDEEADLYKKNWDMGKALARGDRDPHPPPTTLLETKLCLGNYAFLQDAFLDEGLPFIYQVLAPKKNNGSAKGVWYSRSLGLSQV